MAKFWNIGNGRRSPDTLRRWVGSLTAIAVLAVPLVAQLTPCFEECHGEAMSVYDNHIAHGASEGFAVLAGERKLKSCMGEDC